jgi:hypothetical protein
MKNVSRDSATHARLVIRNCKPDEIAAVDQGKLSLARAYASLKDRDPAAPRKKKKCNSTGENPARMERQRQQAVVWKYLREALIGHHREMKNAGDLLVRDIATS